MHDPMCVAFEIRRPWPKRSRIHDAKPGRPRWEWQRHGRWQPWRWSPFVTAFGRGWYFPALVTVWHVEPGGADALTVCRGPVVTDPDTGKQRYEHPHRWRWHVRHWRIQFRPWQAFRARFQRCDECGRRMNKAMRIGVGWDAPGVVHYECSSLRHLRGVLADTDVLVDRLFAFYRAVSDEDEADALRVVLGHRWGNDLWRAVARLRDRLGYEMDSRGELVRRDDEKARP